MIWLYIIIYLIGVVITYGVFFAFIENEYSGLGGMDISSYIMSAITAFLSFAGLIILFIAVGIGVGENTFKHGIQFTKNK